MSPDEFKRLLADCPVVTFPPHDGLPSPWPLPATSVAGYLEQPSEEVLRVQALVRPALTQKPTP